MTFKNYLRDHMIALLFALAAFVIMLLFLIGFHVSVELLVFILATYLLFLILLLLWSFLRKRRFYQELSKILDQLDKGNLCFEMISPPDFLEGKLLHETISCMGKSMTEQINTYRDNTTDFKEYVEMWVHEAKLPIASLRLKQYNLNPEEGRAITTQLQKLDSYTDQILYYTRSEVAEKDFVIHSCCLAKVFGAAVSKLREELLANGFEIRTENLGVSVFTDAKWLEFILGQILSNSIKYASTKDDRTLLIYSTETEKELSLHIKDNGIGIPETDLPRIFDKSFTGENGRIRSKSTGMGLYIAKRLCDKLGHRISAESLQNEYTQITITFAKNDYYCATLQD